MKKSPSAYVCAYKNCSSCHATMLFLSVSTHDHEEVFTNLLHYCNWSKKVFTAPKVIRGQSKNSNFLHDFEPFWLQKWFERVRSSKKSPSP